MNINIIRFSKVYGDRFKVNWKKKEGLSLLLWNMFGLVVTCGLKTLSQLIN